MGIFSSRLAFSLSVPGASLDDLRVAAASAPENVVTTLTEAPTGLSFTASSGFGSPHGGAKGVAELSATQEPGPTLRLEGHLRPGRYNALIRVPFTLFGGLFTALGLLLMIGDLEAVGLVIVGVFFVGMVWLVRHVEMSWMRQMAAGLSAPDGWLLSALR